MKSRQFSAITASLLVAVLLPFANVAVWVGGFPLTLQVEASQPVDVNSLRFAPVWREVEADNVIEHQSPCDVKFSEAENDADGALVIRVPSSGRSGPFGIEYSHVQPSHLLVEFAVERNRVTTKEYRKFEIPRGRGPRTMQISLPQ